MTAKTKILVLGNSPFINEIDFNRIDSDITTFGVNRIWLKYYPDYFFFHDPEIVKELSNKPEIVKELNRRSISFTSDWYKKPIPSWVRRCVRSNRRTFPDSITTGISILGESLLKGNATDYTFYIAGVHLKWMEPSHFWKGTYASHNKHGKEWYDPRFERMLLNFKNLQKFGYNFISVTPNSNLNKIMRYENIANLYTK
jgi:hypothetical protein